MGPRRLKVFVYTAISTIEVLDLAGSPVVKIQATGNVTGNGSWQRLAGP